MKAFDLLVLAPVIIGTEELKIQLPGRNGEIFCIILDLSNCFGYLVKFQESFALLEIGSELY